MKKSGHRTSAVERSRWLAELALAVEQAQQLARAQSDCAQARELFDRLESVRVEIEALRRGGWDVRPAEIDPLWARIFPNRDPKA